MNGDELENLNNYFELIKETPIIIDEKLINNVKD